MGRKLCVSLLLLLLAAGCRTAPAVQTAQFTKTAPSEHVSADGANADLPIRVAAASIISPGETLKSYGKLFAYLSIKVGRPIELVQRKTYEETYSLLRDGTLDIAMICTYIYVHGHDTIGLTLLASPEVRGRAEYQSLILVREETGATSMRDLQGKRFAFTDPLSASGRIYPLVLLKREGLDPGTFFSTAIYTYSHDNSIKALVQGVVDGAAVDSLVYEQWSAKYPDLARQVKIVDRSESMGSPPLVASSRLDSATREAFRRALQTMHEDPDGMEILAELGIDRFVQLKDSDYDMVRGMARLLGMLP